MAGNYYRRSAAEVARQLATDEKVGLTIAEAEKRQAEFGLNQLKEKKGRGPLIIFIEQFKGFIVWVLIGAASVSGIMREWVDALAIVMIVILNGILGFIQEYRAEKSLAALKKLSTPISKVIRDGKLQNAPSPQLVPGDLIELEAGDNVPADSRLTYATANFSTQEASLTGESTPVTKTTLPLLEEEIPLADRANMIYAGTFVAAGRGRAIVAETGMRTELGKIAGMIQEMEEDTTPLQKKLEQFGKWIVYACIALVGMVFLLEILRGGELLNVFLTAVSLAVAAIPEGLPAVVTIALALGVQRMVKRHALIRKLSSVETLGSATVICSDKTGTLTKNEMTVQAVFTGGTLFEVTGVGYEPKGEFKIDGKPIDPRSYPLLEKSLTAAVLCNSAQLTYERGNYRIIGDPTEGALLTCAGKLGLTKEELEKRFPFIEEIPFDAARKKMTIVRRDKDKYIALVKGAPEVLLNDCLIGPEERQRILMMNEELAGRAMRVLAVAYREMDRVPEEIEKDLVFLGLLAMIDPPREEAKEAVAKCKTAGIKVVMITGDHKNTAEAIGRELGIDTVYARVSPEDKIRIVRDLRERGEIVAMTGDGVNDAPAVKEADIGVAMGITGTDVTKEVSDMVITDDNFASIVAAVEEGRGIYGNIKKFVHYLLSCNAGEILFMFVSSLIGLPVPLLPIQILWVNIVTDGLPALALGVDPVDPNIMKRPPRPAKERVITRQQAGLIIVQGGFMAACALLAFTYMLGVGESLAHARTVAFVVLACSQLFHSFNCRSQMQSLFTIGVFKNGGLVIAFMISFILQMAVVYVPFLQVIFKTEPIRGTHWIFVVLLSSFPLWAMEIVKLINQKKSILPND